MLTKEEIEKVLKNSLRALYKNDMFLIEQDVNERSIAHMFAFYLHTKINKTKKKWNVDCEYNRIGKNALDRDFISKTLNLDIEGIETDNTEAKTVFPDIIIHHRGKEGSENNLLVVEIKKNKIRDSKDFKKLDQYGKKLKYKYGVFISISSSQASCYWWVKGERSFTEAQRPTVLYAVKAPKSNSNA